MLNRLRKLFRGNTVALSYLLISFALILVVLFSVDSFLIPVLEDQGKIVSVGWKSENEKLLHFMSLRNRADNNCPVWRSDLFPVSEKKTKSKRILIMGDSYVWGDGYANLNTIWWRQLQLELERRGYHNVEVIAAGLCGAPTIWELNWAKKIVPEYKPDLVIWGYLTNDPKEADNNKVPLVKSLRLPKDTVFPDRVSKVMEGLFPNLSDQLIAVRNKRREEKSGDQYGYQYGDWDRKILEGENFEQYKKTVHQLAEFSRSLPVPSFVMTLPNAITYASKTDGKSPATASDFFENVRHYYNVRYAPVQALFVASGMKFYDILDEFISFASSHAPIGIESSKFAYIITPSNSHPGPMAAHFYAVKAADFLEANYKDALGERTFGEQKTPSNVVINDCVPPDINVRQNAEHAYFVYPNSDDELLSMPIRKPYVLINFEKPTALKTIKLIGGNLKEADVYLNLQPTSKHYDDGPPLELGQKRGTTLSWNVPESAVSDAEVSSIRISAKFKGANHGVLLDITPIAQSTH
jgi:lysophospholipase L1-like esterase